MQDPGGEQGSDGSGCAAHEQGGSRPEQLDDLKRKFHGGAVGLYVADEKTDLYSYPVHVGTTPTPADSGVLMPEALTPAMREVLEKLLTNCHTVDESYDDLRNAAKPEGA